MSQQCQICHHHEWQPIQTLISGVWDKSQTELCRTELKFPIGLCRHCGHTQVTIPYTPEIFASLYPSDCQPDMWCAPDTGQSPYHDMLDFIGSEVIKRLSAVADFGCGEATLLRALQQQCPYTEYYGFDFNVSACGRGIVGVCCDINKLAEITDESLLGKFELVLSTHVLEHVLQPVQFLEQLGRFLRPDGVLFIEVPDCGSEAESCALEQTNLVHGQHLHYYTADSLEKIAALAGFKPVKVAHFITDDIPRLQMLFKKSEPIADFLVIEKTAASAVLLRFGNYQQKIDSLYFQLQHHLNIANYVGLWGIGGDFHSLMQSYPQLLECIVQQQLVLFDYELAGHTYAGQTIQSSTAIESCNFAVLMVPLYTPTRDKMRRVSRKWAQSILDPFLS